uniref:ORF2 protein n=1 Tax=Torque teno sus virus 1b TaxID=687387 RepID=A0A2P1NRK1_9VIRU|nr:ORF2 protein [Torque teno sus virus 1b]
MEKKGLTVPYGPPGLFGDGKNPKKLLEKCLTNAFANPEGNRQDEGDPEGGDATFNFGFDPLLAAPAQR